MFEMTSIALPEGPRILQVCEKCAHSLTDARICLSTRENGRSAFKGP